MTNEQRRAELRGKIDELMKATASHNEAQDSMLAKLEGMEDGPERRTLELKAGAEQARASQASMEASNYKGELARLPVASQFASEPQDAFTRFCRGGHSMLTDDEKQMFCDETKSATGGAGGQYFRLDMWKRQMERERMDTYKVGTEGIALADLKRLGQLAQRLKAYGSVSRAVTQLRSANGNPIKYPYFDVTEKKGAQVGEAVAAPEYVVPTAAGIQLPAYDVGSGHANVSLNAERDTPNAGAIIESMLLRAIGVRVEEELTSGGDGSAGPRGVIHAAQVGKTTANKDTIAQVDLLDLDEFC